jgi:hypothetical protein
VNLVQHPGDQQVLHGKAVGFERVPHFPQLAFVSGELYQGGGLGPLTAIGIKVHHGGVVEDLRIDREADSCQDIQKRFQAAWVHADGNRDQFAFAARQRGLVRQYLGPDAHDILLTATGAAQKQKTLEPKGARVEMFSNRPTRL